MWRAVLDRKLDRKKEGIDEGGRVMELVCWCRSRRVEYQRRVGIGGVRWWWGVSDGSKWMWDRRVSRR